MNVALFTLHDLDVVDGSWLRIVGPARHLADLGCEVTLFAPRFPEALKGKAEFVRVPGRRGNPEPFRRRLLLQAASPALQGISAALPWHADLPGLLNARRPDVIHCHRHSAGLMLLRFLPRLRAPVLLDLHTMYRLQADPAGGLRERAARAVTLRAETRLLRAMDGIVLESEAYRDYVVGRFGLRPDRVFVAPSGADVEFLSEPVSEGEKSALRARHGLAGKRVILFAGTFKPRSGVTDLVLAFRRLREERPETALVLIGDVADMDPQERTAFLGAVGDGVALVGRQSREGYRLFQQIADVQVAPDQDTPFARLFAPLKLYDALAGGKPVVATRIPGRAEWMAEGVNGFLVEPNNPEAMARGLARALEADKAVGARARAMIRERHSFAETARWLVRAYEAVRSSRRA